MCIQERQCLSLASWERPVLVRLVHHGDGWGLSVEPKQIQLPPRSEGQGEYSGFSQQGEHSRSGSLLTP